MQCNPSVAVPNSRISSQKSFMKMTSMCITGDHQTAIYYLSRNSPFPMRFRVFWCAMMIACGLCCLTVGNPVTHQPSNVRNWSQGPTDHSYPTCSWVPFLSSIYFKGQSGRTNSVQHRPSAYIYCTDQHKKLFGINELKTVHTINVIIVVVCQKDEQFSWEFINNLGKLFCTRVSKLREKVLFHQAKQRSR